MSRQELVELMKTLITVHTLAVGRVLSPFQDPELFDVAEGLGMEDQEIFAISNLAGKLDT